jgi:excisionase family DNA binding protein
MIHPALTATLPSEAEAGIAKETSRLLASRLKKGAPMQFRIVGDNAQTTVKLPAAAAGLLLRILEEMARGNAVTIIPVHAELTTQDAADILNISRPSLIKLLEEGKIEYRRVGTHRRVPFDALMKYKRQADEQRRAVLQELAAYDQELGI